jgi:hypothetical protein
MTWPPPAIPVSYWLISKKYSLLTQPTMFRFIWPSGFREDLKKMANQKQELSMAVMFAN